jgi:dUTP pyrophosphatase
MLRLVAQPKSQMDIQLRVKRLKTNATLPEYGSLQAAGLDLFASEDSFVRAHNRNVIKTGIAVAIPDGHYGRIAARSGLSVKKSIDIAAGVIDS